jgi:regulator of protease activity HflC (stomatin/prohibitin superfamily)
VRSNGKASGEWGPGFNFQVPVVNSHTCYETGTTTLEFTYVDSDANYTDTMVNAPTRDGVNVDLTAMLYYRISPEPGVVTMLYRDHRLKGNEQVNDRLIQPRTRERIRTVVGQTPIRTLYPSGMAAVSGEIYKSIRDELDPYGIEVQSFNLTAMNPGAEYVKAIADQQYQQEEATRQQEAQKVIDAQAEQGRIKAKGEADAGIIRAEGKAQENAIIGESIKANPSLLWLEYYAALKEATWAILSPEDVQPTQPLPTVAPKPEG